jgi:hypothetical protein
MRGKVGEAHPGYLIKKMPKNTGLKFHLECQLLDSSGFQTFFWTERKLFFGTSQNLVRKKIS